jgi:hypothetical protein
MARRSVRRCGRRLVVRTLMLMKTLLKLALAGAIAAVLVKWAREAAGEGRIPTVNPMGDWEPDAGEPLRGENLTTEPSVTH